MKSYYNLYVGLSAPSNPIMGCWWIKPDISQAYVRINSQWIPVAGDAPIENYIDEKSYWYDMIVQEEIPSGIDDRLGKIWIKPSIKQAYIKLNDWIPFAGG